MTYQHTTNGTYSTGHMFNETVAMERVADRQREVEATMRANALRSAVTAPERARVRRIAMIASPVAAVIVLIISSAL